MALHRSLPLVRARTGYGGSGVQQPITAKDLAGRPGYGFAGPGGHLVVKIRLKERLTAHAPGDAPLERLPQRGFIRHATDDEMGLSRSQAGKPNMGFGDSVTGLDDLLRRREVLTDQHILVNDLVEHWFPPFHDCPRQELNPH